MGEEDQKVEALGEHFFFFNDVVGKIKNESLFVGGKSKKLFFFLIYLIYD